MIPNDNSGMINQYDAGVLSFEGQLIPEEEVQNNSKQQVSKTKRKPPKSSNMPQTQVHQIGINMSSNMRNGTLNAQSSAGGLNYQHVNSQNFFHNQTMPGAEITTVSNNSLNNTGLMGVRSQPDGLSINNLSNQNIRQSESTKAKDAGKIKQLIRLASSRDGTNINV